VASGGRVLSAPAGGEINVEILYGLTVLNPHTEPCRRPWHSSHIRMFHPSRVWRRATSDFWLWSRSSTAPSDKAHSVFLRQFPRARDCKRRQKVYRRSLQRAL